MKKEGNYAFVDTQNLYLGVLSLGWKLDYKKFRIYLKEKYGVTVAYMFMGYVPTNQALYTMLTRAGYTLIFKPIVHGPDGTIKGNVDAELVLQTMIDFEKLNKAILVTSDGDFYCLVNHLYKHNKLARVLSPYKIRCSKLLKQAARGELRFLASLQEKLEYKNKKALLRDRTTQ